MTVYLSPGDKAFGLSDLLFGSVLRLGQLAPAQ
ncbi:alpha/beta hydrolase [Microvirga ossetica]|nr:alpha/beta hydrolase [Microvirga ossetica]